MLLNNLDREVAEKPEELIVYGGSGKAARNHDALKALGDKEFPRSADLYQSVLVRSAELRAHEALN